MQLQIIELNYEYNEHIILSLSEKKIFNIRTPRAALNVITKTKWYDTDGYKGIAKHSRSCLAQSCTTGNSHRVYHAISCTKM